MEYCTARPIAERWLDHLSPHCECIYIAGSLRRGKPEVGDIEIVAIPTLTPQYDMFDAKVGELNELALLLHHLANTGQIVMRKNGPRYKQIQLAEGINLDLFMVLPPAQWGVIFCLRTGPADFSQWLVTPRRCGGALPAGCAVTHGAVWQGSEIIPMPEEQNFFDFLGLAWIEPDERHARWGGII